MKCAKDIVQYYSGHGGDGRGRSLAEVQGWQDDQLEAVHDFIQWMFPLREYSNFNRDAPVLDDDAISQFQVSSELRSRLRLSFIRMLKFYGFEMLVAPEKRVIRSAAFPQRARQWMSPGNHNYLRITRILKSLSLLGLAEDARLFFACLSEIYEAQNDRHKLISPETFRYWKEAVLDKAV